MQNKIIAILLVLVSTLFTAVAQILFKYASKTVSLNYSILLNYFFLLGLFCYGVGFLFLVYSLRLEELSILYPFYSASFIWVTLFSPVLFLEQMTLLKIIGILFIVLGLVIISRGGNKK